MRLGFRGNVVAAATIVTVAASQASISAATITRTVLNPPTSPPATHYANLATDPRGGVLLFGGWHDNQTSRQTWSWDGTTWQREFPTVVSD